MSKRALYRLNSSVEFRSIGNGDEFHATVNQGGVGRKYTMTRAMRELLGHFTKPRDVESVIDSLDGASVDIDAAREFLKLVVLTPLMDDVDSDCLGVRRAELFARLRLTEEATYTESKRNSVYRVRDAFGMQRILKVSFPHDSHSNKGKMAARILNEFALLRKLQHIKGVVRVYDCESEPVPYLLVQYSSGRKVSKLGDLSFDRRVALCERIAEVVEQVHEAGIIHGDIHLGNFLVDDFDQITMIDFDCSFEPGKSPATRIGGALPFLPPERVFKSWREGIRVPASAASDIYQLGVMFYWILTNMMPFRAPTSTALVNAITTHFPDQLMNGLVSPCTPPHLKLFVDRALSKNPDERPQSLRKCL
jgi:serine/threonine protein kinase